MNAALERALEHLKIVTNISSGLTHSSDESTAKETFKYLHKLGIRLEYDEVYLWAKQHGWEDRHARELAVLAEKIGSGGRVVVKHKGRLSEDFQNELRSLK
ncbi:hypothetical protein BV921_04475 [Pectobacterium odoriferum]|uniref:DUF1889 family protein n=1 Tax=Pectobacterium odoriferum TaxID=78398 RepID=UPI000CD1C3F3|nr:DUF1889 family protein [Pectobacterium odoriferum]POE11635.1 hypothetical protein BV921_04475 [Pectobacterium odoriferum]